MLSVAFVLTFVFVFAFVFVFEFLLFVWVFVFVLVWGVGVCICVRICSGIDVWNWHLYPSMYLCWYLFLALVFVFGGEGRYWHWSLCWYRCWTW